MTIRAPHFSKRVSRKVQQPQPVANLLLTTLVVVAAVPFAQTDWPNPEPLPTQQPLQLGMPLVILEDAGEKPFNQLDWPNPTLATHIQTPVQIGASIVLSVPFRQTQWPNPTVDVLVQPPFQVGSSLNLIETGGEKPFAQTDWPNPILPPVPITLQVGSSVDLLTTIVPKPFNQLDWPNPIPLSVPVTWQAGISLDLLSIVTVSVRIAGISLSMSANEILLRQEQPNIRLKQIASKIVFRE